MRIEELVTQGIAKHSSGKEAVDRKRPTEHEGLANLVEQCLDAQWCHGHIRRSQGRVSSHIHREFARQLALCLSQIAIVQNLLQTGKGTISKGPGCVVAKSTVEVTQLSNRSEQSEHAPE